MRLAYLVAAGWAFASLAAAGESPARLTQALLIEDAQIAEGTFGTRTLSFRVTLSEPSGGVVTVDYRTQNETARAGEDYEVTQGTLRFGPDEMSKAVGVPIKGDRKVEPDEFFSMILFARSGGTVAEPGGAGTGAIQNDDVPALLCNCKRVTPRLAGFVRHGATQLSGVVKVTMTCGTGDVANCAGFVKTVLPIAKPKLFTCTARKCSSTNTYTFEVRVASSQTKLRLRAGCRGERGELRTFTLAPPK